MNSAEQGPKSQVVWRHTPLAEPFGDAVPEEDPDGDGVRFLFNLRFPGQYYDRETDTHYNYYRDHYFPQFGRYGQSDPIGLEGGVNTYAYGGGNPVSWVDPWGLSEKDVERILKRIDEIIDGMTRDGLRLPDPQQNNRCAVAPWLFPGCKSPNNYKRCGDQVDYMLRILEDEHGKNEDHWGFYMESAPGHAWGVAISNNPEDPWIYFDPWTGQKSKGTPCPWCQGWFGGRTYTLDNMPHTGVRPKPRK